MIKPQKSNLIFKYHLTFSTYRSHKSLSDLISMHFEDDGKYYPVSIYFRKDIYFIVRHYDRADFSLPTRYYLCKTDYQLKTFAILYTSPEYAGEEYGQTEITDFNGQIAFILFQSNLQIIDVQRGIMLIDETQDDFTGACYQCKDGKFVSLAQIRAENKSRLLILKINEGKITKTVFYVNKSNVSLVGIVDNIVLFYSWEDGQHGYEDELKYYGVGYYNGKYIDEKIAAKMSKKVKAYWYEKQSTYFVTIKYPDVNSVQIYHRKNETHKIMTISELINKNDYLRDELSKDGFELCKGFYYEKQIFFVWGRKIDGVTSDHEEPVPEYKDAHIFRYDMKKETLSYLGYLDGPGADFIEVIKRPE